jgi:hypothetical protein
VEPALPLGAAELAAEFGLVAELSVPLDAAEFAAEFWSVGELAEPLIGPEGEVVPPLPAAEPALLGFAALLGAMLLLELLVVEPLVPESWANTAGAKAATDNAKPAPSK